MGAQPVRFIKGKSDGPGEFRGVSSLLFLIRSEQNWLVSAKPLVGLPQSSTFFLHTQDSAPMKGTLNPVHGRLD